MPFHLELGSEGHPFAHHRAIVVNSRTGEHLTRFPINKTDAEIVMSVADKKPSYIKAEKKVAEEEAKKVKALVGLRKVESETKARNTKKATESKTKAGEMALEKIYKMVEKVIDARIADEGKILKSDLDAEKIRYLKNHIIGDNDAITKATRELTTKHDIVPGSEIDNHAEAYWRKEVNKRLKAEPPKKPAEKPYISKAGFEIKPIPFRKAQ